MADPEETAKTHPGSPAGGPDRQHAAMRAKGLRVIFRVDSSKVIGTGHVMRCLVLAQALRSEGALCRFICADLAGDMTDHLTSEGFEVARLATPADHVADPGDYASWSGLAWQEDAASSSTFFQDRVPDWIILDHYGLDARWEDRVKGPGTRLLVLDDLANRPHQADLLVDQNFGRTAQDYLGLVPETCVIKAGPENALLRPEFAALRPATLRSRPGRQLRHILISMGGVDLPDATSALLAAMTPLALPKDLGVTVVMGRAAPHLEAVRRKAAQLPFHCHVATSVANMHDLMASADLAIGAVGGTAWERCVLGLPSLMLTIADNQMNAARALDDAGAAIYLGDIRFTGWQDRLATALAEAEAGPTLDRLSAASARLTDGRGIARLLDVLVERPAPPG